MTTEEKFRKILKIAEQNGFKIDKSKFINHEDAPPVMALLFNKAFARAIFGEEKTEVEGGREWITRKGWQWYLQQAVLSDEPIDYYYDNLPQENPAFWDDTLETVIDDK